MTKTESTNSAAPKQANSTKVKKSFTLSLASFCASVTGLLLSMVMVRLLTLEDVAVYKQTLLAYQTFVPILGLGITQGIYYVFSRNDNRQRAVLHECCLLLIITGSIYALFILFGGNVLLALRVKNEAVSSTLLWMVPLAIISNPAEIRSSVFVYQDKIGRNAAFSTLSNLASMLLILFSVFVFRTGTAAVGAYSISYFIAGIVGLYLAYRLVPKDSGRMAISSIKNILSISVPLGAASMLGTLSSSLDKWIISFMRTPEEYAVFSYGAHELPFISTVAGAISTVIIVEMVNSTKEKRYDKAIELFKSVAKATSYFIFPITVLFMILAEPFYEFMYTEAMLPAVPVFRVYLLMLPIRTVMYGPLLIALGKSKQVLLRTCLSLAFNLVLSVFLVRKIGAIGATIASVIAVYAVNIPFNLAVISKESKIKWTKILPFGHYGKCLLASIIPAIICVPVQLCISDLSAVLQLVTVTVIYFAILAAVFFVFFRSDMSSYLKGLCSFIKSKLAKSGTK